VEPDSQSGGEGGLGRVPGSPSDDFSTVQDVDRQSADDQEVERRVCGGPDMIGHP
jgi:hypothetical protein